MSKKSKNWIKFSDDVAKHIEEYVINQYGDDGEDPADEYNADTCLQQVKKYLTRIGKSSRPNEERRDVIKAAHYLQMAYDRLDTLND